MADIAASELTRRLHEIASAAGVAHDRLASALLKDLYERRMLHAWARGAQRKTDLDEQILDDLVHDGAMKVLVRVKSMTPADVPEPARVMSVLFNLVQTAVKDLHRSPARRNGITGVEAVQRRAHQFRAAEAKLAAKFMRPPTTDEVIDHLNASRTAARASREAAFDGANHIVPEHLAIDDRDVPDLAAMSLRPEAVARDLTSVAQVIYGRDPQLVHSMNVWVLGVADNSVDADSTVDLAAAARIDQSLAATHLEVIHDVVARYRQMTGG